MKTNTPILHHSITPVYVLWQSRSSLTWPWGPGFLKSNKPGLDFYFFPSSVFLPGLSVYKDHPHTDQDKGQNQICADNLTQDQHTAHDDAQYGCKKWKGMKETDGIPMDEFKPDEKAEEGDDDTLVKKRET